MNSLLITLGFLLQNVFFCIFFLLLFLHEVQNVRSLGSGLIIAAATRNCIYFISPAPFASLKSLKNRTANIDIHSTTQEYLQRCSFGGEEVKSKVHCWFTVQRSTPGPPSESPGGITCIQLQLEPTDRDAPTRDARRTITH